MPGSIQTNPEKEKGITTESRSKHRGAQRILHVTNVLCFAAVKKIEIFPNEKEL